MHVPDANVSDYELPLMSKFMKLEVFQESMRVKKINKPSEVLDIDVSIFQLHRGGNTSYIFLQSVTTQQKPGASREPSQRFSCVYNPSYRPCNQNIINARAFYIFFVSKLSNIPFLNPS